MATGLLSRLIPLRRRVSSVVLIATFGSIMTAAAWLQVLQRQSTDRASEFTRIRQENAALARAFEEHVRRVMQSADNALLYLQGEYQASGRATEEIARFMQRMKADPILNQIALADASGNLFLSAHGKPLNIAHREHFQAHASGGALGLHIAKPVLTVASGTWSFFLSRRLSNPDGSFAGIAAVGLNPAYFAEYYDTPELGPDRGVLLVGRDGIVRARRFQRQSVVGQNLGDSPMFKAIVHAPAGDYEVTGSIDSLRRFVSYRALPDYPLIVAVSNLSSAALAPLRRRAAESRLSALIFTLFVAIFCLVLIRAERRTQRDNARLTAELAERRRAEEALSESESLFAAFLDHIPAVVFVQDLQGRILYSNQAYHDLPGREAIGANAREVLAPVQGTPPGGPAALRGRSVVLDEQVADGTGQTLIFETRMFLVDRSGRPPLLGCVSVDSTGRRHSEEQRLLFERRIQQAQKLESLGVLAGGVAHDFNNLLLVILGNADLALSKLATESPARGFIGSIEMAAQRAAELANQMLAYSGKGRFLIEPVNLSRLVEEMGALLGSVISRHARVSYRLGADLPPVQGDATQLRQVVMNLITNASDALAGRAGDIAVATSVLEIAAPGNRARASPPPLPGGTYVCLEVSDTGAGMDDATQSLIFDPFYTTKETGRGLGLASVFGIVRGHCGEIRVSSRPGKGTTFTVLLPAAPAGQRPPPEDAGMAAAATERTGSGAPVILLVDDEPHVLETTRAMLEESGFSVLTAVDGVDAVEIFRNESARLSAVLLDMNMPRMDGAAAFRRMRDIAPGVPVLLTSGLDEGDAVGELTGAGLAGFIQKPYRLRSLLQKLAGVLAPGATQT